MEITTGSTCATAAVGKSIAAKAATSQPRKQRDRFRINLPPPAKLHAFAIVFAEGILRSVKETKKKSKQKEGNKKDKSVKARLQSLDESVDAIAREIQRQLDRQK